MSDESLEELELLETDIYVCVEHWIPTKNEKNLPNDI